MPIMRNPFRKQDENVRPVTSGNEKDTNGSPTKPVDIKKSNPVEYKLSEINDSGVFIPPSPTEEKKSFWTTSSSRSTTSSHHSRSVFNENEPFNISRESFDSYRRSFDISARSPIMFADAKPRSSLDSRTFQQPRQSNSFHRPLQVPGTQQEEDVEVMDEIALDDPKPQPKKRGMFSRMLDSESHTERPVNAAGKDGAAKSSWHHFGGRKRGQSGQGAELGDIPKREETPRPESQTSMDRVVEAPQQQPDQQPLKQLFPQKPAAQQATQQVTPQSSPQEQSTAGAEQANGQEPVATVDGSPS